MATPNATGYVARFTGPDPGDHDRTWPVVGFSDEGHPLVLVGGVRVHTINAMLPTQLGGLAFAGLQYVGTIVAALPAQGWRARQYDGWDDPRSYHTSAEDVVGWNVYSDGTSSPVVMDEENPNNPRDLRQLPGDYSLIAPDGTEMDSGTVLGRYMDWCGQCDSRARRYRIVDGVDGPCTACHIDHRANASRSKELHSSQQALRDQKTREVLEKGNSSVD